MDETARAIAVAGLILAALSLAVSGLSFVVAFWVARRDNPRVKLEASIGYVTTGVIPLASPRITVWEVGDAPLFNIDVINYGRRPVTIIVAGFLLRTTGVWRALFWDWKRGRPDRLVWVTSNSNLPARLDDQAKVTFFSTLEDSRSELRNVLKSHHQLAGIYADDVTGKRYIRRLPRGLWRSLRTH